MNIDKLAYQARPWYDADIHFNRHYHNWNHACRVVSNCYTIKNDTPSQELILAAWWHDAVYVPGAGSDANERCSAAALVNASKLFAEPELTDTIAQAAFLIQSTSVETHLTYQSLTGDLAILLDADLVALADPYDQFVQTQKRIIVENGGTFENDKAKSAAFLQQFLTRRYFIYHTDYARGNWEVQARANITRYIKESL